MQFFRSILESALEIHPDRLLYFPYVGYDHLDARRAKILPCPSAHTAADHNVAIAESFGYRSMTVMVPFTGPVLSVCVVMTVMFVVTVMMTFPEVPGEGIFTHRRTDDISVFDLIDGESRTSSEMLRYCLFVLRCDCDLHVFSFLHNNDNHYHYKYTKYP
jgi:hypothetical protein